MSMIPTEIVLEVADLLLLVDEISELADSEKDALGFWRRPALEEAIHRKNLFALVRTDRSNQRLVGYIHHSGAFPHAKVQQVAIKPEYRKSGFATALLNKLVSRLEGQGFFSLRADIAEDLQGSLDFYRSQGFVEVFRKAGGVTRRRQIRVHERSLDTDDLFTFSGRSNAIDFGIKRRSARDRPIYAFDLNVYFDLVRDRSKSEFARRIFASALAHEVRLVVSSEFTKELERTSAGKLDDPILQMALRLPSLPSVDADRLQRVSDYVHTLVFVEAGLSAAFTDQAISDAKHVAHAALARAAGFVTRDGSLLAARTRLLDSLGIDVIDTNELDDMLPSGLSRAEGPQVGEGFALEPLTSEIFTKFLAKNGVQLGAFESLQSELWVSNRQYCEGILSDGKVVAVAAAEGPNGTQRSSQFLIFVEPGHPKAALFADHLLDRATAVVGAGKPTAIQLLNLPGQSIVSAVAQSKAFRRSRCGSYYEKFSLGHPLTFSNWERSATELRRCTGLILPRTIENWDRATKIAVRYPSGESIEVSLDDLDALLCPTLLITPTTSGVLVPIKKSFADELLGTSKQEKFKFLENKDASFVSTRGYVNSPNRATFFRPDTPILFYESLGSGGRGAVVAMARIRDSLVMGKKSIGNAVQQTLVVDDFDSVSNSSKVLVTTFDNLLRFPKVSPLSKLREIGAIDGANLVSARAIDAHQIDAVLQHCWVK